MSSPTRLPELPIVCLKSANCHTTLDAFVGKNAVIDFWTTRCTRCPDALDKLNGMAQDPKYANVDFISICCDSCDGAREILEKPDVPRWDAIHHYYMDPESKETAKKVLGFSMVPFYVFLNDKGEIVQKGNTNAVDFDQIPGVDAAAAPAAASGGGEREFVMDEDF
eukprot:CAMPEP_0185804374 /NCGR_PEP_ID=MMETSP1322-20130828/3216_1 /TAXON_ID=265543 /ORGANISM="Minutocellus polymorphus, Strain RCC2270" /LENGTH=165 /DNA_ID=CAMNT_0028500343 /DNA_START=33 /DNA_END=530 /DNA_ORIENTATION=+